VEVEAFDSEQIGVLTDEQIARVTDGTARVLGISS